MNNFPAFFENNEYLIDEKVAFLKFTNAYKVYNAEGEQIGNIQQKMPAALKLLSLVLNKGMFPFTLHIKDMDDKVLATIKRGWTFWMSKVKIYDDQETLIAQINQKFKVFTSKFNILDAEARPLATINGSWSAWNFQILDNDNKPVGNITKQWQGGVKGMLREAFTSADKYAVSIDPEVKEDVKKVAIVSTAITIDMVMHENK